MNLTLGGSTQGWFKTNMLVENGDKLVVNAQGKIRFAKNAPFTSGYPRNPDGQDEYGKTEIAPSGWPAPGRIRNSLVLRVGNEIEQGGTSKEIIFNQSGYLEICNNDDNCSDNDGYWSIDFGIIKSNPRIYYDSQLQVTIKEHWLNFPNDGFNGNLNIIATWLKQINNNINKPNLFKNLIVEVWNIDKARSTNNNIDWGIENAAGLSSDPKIMLSSIYANAGTLSHEMGHIFHQKCGIQFDGILDANFRPKNLMNGIINPGDTRAENIRKKYRALRSVDYTYNTTEVERFAEDFKYFFGAVGVIHDDSKDDANGGKVHFAKDVIGLEDFFKNIVI